LTVFIFFQSVIITYKKETSSISLITAIIILKIVVKKEEGNRIMYELKTKETDSSVIEFIENVDSVKKREDAYQLLDIFTETTGFEAKMWGPSIIGFGSYHYKYDSGHEGDAPLVGFSPRKAKISLYFAPGETKREELLKMFGKHTTGKACVYINKVADIDTEVLIELIHQSVKFLQEMYPTQ
jgi:hypothetical protein